jgi:hypothetical protein
VNRQRHMKRSKNFVGRIGDPFIASSGDKESGQSGQKIGEKFRSKIPFASNYRRVRPPSHQSYDAAEDRRNGKCAVRGITRDYIDERAEQQIHASPSVRS